MKGSSLFLFLFLIAAFGCSKEITKPIVQEDADTLSKIMESAIIADSASNDIAPEARQVSLGIDVLIENDFGILKGKNIGLITNQTGYSRDLRSTIDILHESDAINLVALFGPEHGVRGDVEGGRHITTYKDEKTGLPVFSLYGKTKKPDSKMLRGIDALVYDIQDIGVRSYTFISTMGLAMEAASENGLEFVVLDRPNPLGGEKIEGNIVEKDYISFISQYPIPYVYGLTCGELAILLVNEKLIEADEGFQPHIIKMKNWERWMTWEDTGLQWIPTSPHIPQSISAIFYPMTGILGELRSAISIGVGYTLPFQVVGTDWINSNDLILQLESYNIPGIKFRPITYQPYYSYGEGEVLNGVQFFISDYASLNLTKTQFYIIDAIHKLYPQNYVFDIAESREIGMFNKAIGSEKIYYMIMNGKPLSEILDYLDKDYEKFKSLSKKYLLYL